MRRTNLTVVDSVMGRGKSSWAINLINSTPEENYIIVVPTLEECSRYKESITRLSYEPRATETTDSVNTLQDRFKLLASEHKTIITTHRMLECLDAESMEILRHKNYTLILDEVTDLVRPFDGITRRDYELLLNDNVVSEELQPDGLIRIVTGTNSYSDIVNGGLKLSVFTEAVKTGNVYFVNKTFFIIVGSTERFRVFDDVYILTYLFKGSLMDAWLTYHGDGYERRSIEEGELVDYKDDGGGEFKHLINLETDKSFNRVGRGNNLSSSWYKNAKPEYILEMKSNLQLFFRRLGVQPVHCLWSVFKDKALAVAPARYTTTCKGLSLRKAMSLKDPRDRAEKLCFTAINTRATNNYKHKTAVAVLVNYYAYPSIISFFREVGVEFDQDRYALSELIQLVWRSRIRESKEINLYLPSERMRGLLNNWLES